MPELCQTCVSREIDYGGYRCQAMALLGDPGAVDPMFKKTPKRSVVDHQLITKSKKLTDNGLFYGRI